MNDTKGMNRPNRPDWQDEDPPTLAHGRFAGELVADVPEINLKWLLAFDIEGHALRNAIRRHLNMRAEA